MQRCELLGFAEEKISTDSLEKWIETHSTEPPGTPRDTGTRKSQLRFDSCLLAISYYVLGEDAKAMSAFVESVAYVEDYFLGDWRDYVPAGNYGDQPPDPEYWHQQPWEDAAFLQSLCALSIAGRWDVADQLAEYWATIRWREAKMGTWPWYELPKHYEVAWALALARLMRGQAPDDLDVQPLIEMVRVSKRRRENLLMDFALAIFAGTDKQLRVAATLYCDYFRKAESKQSLITKKVMIEGTFLVNLARHLGRTLELPELIGPRYIHFEQ